MLRPVGNIEKFSTASHSLGFYRGVANTARYRTDSEPQLLDSVIEAAVAQVVLKHPALCCGIINEDEKDPEFIRLESIDLSECIQYQLPKLSQAEDDAIVEALSVQHGQTWPNIDSQPPWKIIVVPTRKWSDTKGTGFDIIFAYHHALGDGLSGVVFHRSFLDALNNPLPPSSLINHVLKVPASITLEFPIEKAVNFQIGWIFFFKTMLSTLLPKWLYPASPQSWTGAVPSLDHLTNYKTNVSLIQISSEQVSKVLSACKSQKATLTGLLHGLILMSLAKRIPSASTFTTATPYSLRYLTGMSATSGMGNHVGSLKLQQPTKVISDLRSAKNPAETMKQIWDIARDFRASMATELAGLPNDNLIGMIPYISDLHKMLISMVGRPRSNTYEISNVGSLRIDGEPGKWRIERDVFSQSGSVTGAAIYFNVASVAGGPLTIAATWLEGVVDNALVGDVMKDLEYFLKCVGEGKEIALDI
ncbi:alcohol acetyltransferase [Cadophora sp. MPI-SDFR-AT-0126]|nr:alcohol acetyltransferase [Leotiomycetes sp. MPI-SDFR-AT-0126]